LYFIILVNPREEAFAPDEFPATKGNARDCRATADTPSHRVADMRLRAVQQFGDIGESKQIKIAEPVHDAPPASNENLNPSPWRATNRQFHHATESWGRAAWCGGAGLPRSWSFQSLKPNGS
jgi:hypothetical protein